ncbi:MAG: metallophosphoesterase [Bacteroidetes bacterium]|nr:metallophosphoesterase [Bacteroidota bacterium]
MRRFQGLSLVILLVVVAMVEYYTFSAIKFATRALKPNTRYIIYGIYIAITIAWFSMFVMMPMMRQPEFNKILRNFMVSFAMGILITKIMIALILFLDDLRRVGFHVAALLYGNQHTPQLVQNGMSRSQFINSMALLVGGTLFSTMLYGMSNRYNYNLKKLKLTFGNLPAAFRGLKIIHISDIHSGSFTNTAAVQKGIDMINAQKPDVVFFTGDLVNNRSDEMYEYMDTFKQISAPMGVYSIFGNHDYGDYVDWKSEADKAENLELLKKIHAKLGWRLLLDENIALERNGAQIGLIGVQNTSFKNRFHTYGDMKKAYIGAESMPFKILLSHDPSHWDGEINTKYTDVDLTLSGHTHGFQFGVDIPWLKWSPVQYIYKQWAGLYQQGEQYLYINRGFGFLGYPGRVGMLPEITLIELA